MSGPVEGPDGGGAGGGGVWGVAAFVPLGCVVLVVEFVPEGELAVGVGAAAPDPLSEVVGVALSVGGVTVELSLDAGVPELGGVISLVEVSELGADDESVLVCAKADSSGTNMTEAIRKNVAPLTAARRSG
jgi:hypothetical protein